MHALELHRVGKQVRAPGGRGWISILEDITLTVDLGQTVAIQGPSGSGKSTLLAIIGLLDTHTSGHVSLNGTDVARLRSRARDQLRSQTYGFVFQRFCLLGHLTALENVEVALLNGRLRPKHRRRLAGDALERVGLGERTEHRPPQLSGGEQQRVALARAMVSGAPVLLADEPTGSLDQTTGAAVMQQIRTAAAEYGRTLVVVTHDDLLAQGFDRRHDLDHGRIVQL